MAEAEPKFYFYDKTALEAPPVPATPVDLRWQRVEEFLQSREFALNTRKAYERELRRFASWTEKPWHAITAQDVDRFKTFLKEGRSQDTTTDNPGARKPLKAASSKRALAALQSFFKWLSSWDYISKNPTLVIEKPKLEPLFSKELKASEVRALQEALENRGETEARDTALLAVLEHGLRASELAALNIEDYDGVRLLIRRAKADSVGAVPLLQPARRSLDAYLGWRLRQGLPVTPNSPLFLSTSNNSKGQRLSYWGIYKIMKELAQAAGVEDFHPHRLRHTFGTKLVLKKMDSTLARQLMRHKSEASFERYTRRALEIEAENQFYEVFGEEHPDGAIKHGLNE